MDKKRVAKKSAKKTSLVISVKEDALTMREQKELGDAVSFINARLDKASSSVIEIGQYLLDKFFDGDINKARGRASRKGISLRKLADHPEINISFAGLSNAVNLAVQEKQISTVQTSEQLTASHKVLLLKVADLKDKEKYIIRIATDRLSVRAFHDMLEQDGFVKPRGLAAIDSATERKLLRSGFKQYIDSFESIVTLDLDRLLDMPVKNVQSAYDAAKKARQGIDRIIRKLEGKLKQH